MNIEQLFPCPLPAADPPAQSKGPALEAVWPRSAKSAAKPQPVRKSSDSAAPSRLCQTLLFLLPKSCHPSGVTFLLLLLLYDFPPGFLPRLVERKHLFLALFRTQLLLYASSERNKALLVAEGEQTGSFIYTRWEEPAKSRRDTGSWDCSPAGNMAHYYGRFLSWRAERTGEGRQGWLLVLHPGPSRITSQPLLHVSHTTL